MFTSNWWNLCWGKYSTVIRVYDVLRFVSCVALLHQLPSSVLKARACELFPLFYGEENKMPRSERVCCRVICGAPVGLLGYGIVEARLNCLSLCQLNIYLYFQLLFIY